MLEYKGYHANVVYDEDDNILVGKVIGLKDMIGFHADSVESISDQFHEAVDEYLDFCKEIGKNPDREYKGTFNVRISPDLHRKLAEKAIQTHSTLNASVEKAIQQYVG